MENEWQVLVGRVNERFESSQREVQTLRGLNQKLSNEQKEVLRRLEDSERELSSLRASNQKLFLECNENKELINNLQVSLRQQEKENATLSQNVRSLEQKANEAVRKNSELLNQVLRKESECKKIQEDDKKLQQENKNLREQELATNEENMELHKKVMETYEDNRKLREENKKFREEIKNLSEENQEPRRKILKPAGKLEITKLDTAAESVVITNNSDYNIDLSGWELLSGNTKLRFNFSDKVSFILAPQESVTIWSGEKNKGKHNPPHDLFWTERRVWSDQRSSVRLFKDGKIISSFTAA